MKLRTIIGIIYYITSTYVTIAILYHLGSQLNIKDNIWNNLVGLFWMMSNAIITIEIIYKKEKECQE